MQDEHILNRSSNGQTRYYTGIYIDGLSAAIPAEIQIELSKMAALPLHHWSYHKRSYMQRIMDSFSSEHVPVEGSYKCEN
jgi:hypothetical protein